MHLWRLLIFTLAAFLIGSIPLPAQTVSVHSGEDQGHGFLLQHAGSCYVILPRHVAAGRRSVTVFSAAPVVHGAALMETPFWEGMDLAIGIVRGAVEKRCTRDLPALAASVQPENGAEVQLLRLRPSGEPERIDMLITNSQYLTLEAAIVDGQSELFKGTSGAFLFTGDSPVGMVTEALSPTTGRFIRIEEIYLNVKRRLERRAGLATATDAPEPVGQLAPEGEPRLDFDLVSASLAPTHPDHSEANLATRGTYAFRLTRPNRLAFKVRGDAAVTLSRIEVRADPQSGFGIPRRILIELSNRHDGSRPRLPTSVEMGPDGMLNIAIGQSTRWVFLTVVDGWDSSTLGLSSVTFR